MDRKAFSRAAVSGAVLALAMAGGYIARAETEGRAVNARPVASAPTTAPVSFADIVDRVAPAVVSIEVDSKMTPAAFTGRAPQGFLPFGDDDDDSLPPALRRFFQQGQPFDAEPQLVRGAGSGFFISPDGYIATNNHVIDNADKITVRTADKRTFTAHVVGKDKATDLAVLKVDAHNMPFVDFEDSAKPRVGDWVVAVGNPFGLGGTATAGIVSALNRQNVSGSNYVDYMQIDAPINRGNSGGPTFDLRGRVVGVNTAIFSPSGGSVGIGFDIPADVAASVTRQLMAGGKITRAYIGANIQDITPDIAEGLGVEAKGALVADIVKGGPAQAAGLQSGDIVLKVDGHEVSGASDLTRQVGIAKVGGALRLDIRRDGRPMQISVRPGERPDEDKLASAAAEGPKDRGDSASVLGLNVTPDPKDEGLRVAGVARGSVAADQGLKSGDVIVRAGERVTRSAGDLAAAVSSARAAGRKQIVLLVERGGQRSFIPLPVGEG